MAEENGPRWSEGAKLSSGYGAEVEAGPQTETSRDARNMAMLCHLLGVVGFFAPLLIWLIERDKHRFVDEHGRQAMNYQISLWRRLLAAVPVLHQVRRAAVASDRHPPCADRRGHGPGLSRSPMALSDRRPVPETHVGSIRNDGL